MAERFRGEIYEGIPTNKLINIGWDCIKNAVRIAVGRHKQFVIFLSGGLDSGLIAAACVEMGYEPTAHTVAFEGAEDSPDATQTRLTANHLHIPLIIHTMKQKDLADCRSMLCAIMGEPPVAGGEQIWFAYERVFGGPHVMPIPHLVLGGHGGDEYWGGYPWQYAVPSEDVRPKMNLLVSTNLVPLLYVESRIAAHFSVKLRMPLLDPVVTGFASRLPTTCLYDVNSDLAGAKGGKMLMRQIAGGKLPEAVVQSKKFGFRQPRAWHFTQESKG